MKLKQVEREYKEFVEWAIKEDIPARKFLAIAREYQEIIADLKS